MIHIELGNNYPQIFMITVPFKTEIGTNMDFSGNGDILDGSGGDNVLDGLGGGNAQFKIVHCSTYQETILPIHFIRANSYSATLDIFLMQKPLLGQYQAFLLNNNKIIGTCLLKIERPATKPFENKENRTLKQEYDK